jgi:peroxiredoxin
MKQLGELQDNISEFKKLNADVIAFATRGDQYDVEQTQKLHKITLTLIPKPNRAVAENFGLGKNVFGIIIIDKKGRIRYKKIDNRMEHRSARIIRELQGI